VKETITRGREQLSKIQIFCVFLCMILLFSNASKLIAQDAPLEVIQAAEEGLPLFLSEIPPGALEDYGFDENDNLDDAVLDQPFLLYVIDPTALDDYREGDTVYDVLRESLLWYFPIMINDAYKSLLVVDKLDGVWQAVSFGYARLAIQLEKILLHWPRSEGYDPLLSVSWQAGTYCFTVPQVDLYNLTRLDYYPPPPIDQINYEDLRPLSETVKYLKPIVEEAVNADTGDGSSSSSGCAMSDPEGESRNVFILLLGAFGIGLILQRIIRSH
jgi:hypothetical protein